MAIRFNVCIYNFLGTRPTLGKPELGDKCCLATGEIGLPESRRNRESDTRAILTVDPNNRLEHMKAIVQTANVEGETISLREAIPFWFAVSSPLLGALIGLLGAWFVAWLGA